MDQCVGSVTDLRLQVTIGHATQIEVTPASQCFRALVLIRGIGAFLWRIVAPDAGRAFAMDLISDALINQMRRSHKVSPVPACEPMFTTCSCPKPYHNSAPVTDV